MKRTLPLLCLALLPGAAFGAEYAKLVMDKSRIEFTAKQMNVPTDGAFKRFKAQIALDPASPQTGTARIDVEPASWDAGLAEVNEEMLGKNWFDAKQFPTASFVSTSVKALGGDRYEARGKMTMKGKTRDVVATFLAKPQGTNLVLTGSFPLKRLDYGVGTGTWGDTDIVADEVQVKFQFVLAQGK